MKRNYQQNMHEHIDWINVIEENEINSIDQQRALNINSIEIQIKIEQQLFFIWKL